jgi:3-deoxy-D-manno-octulosonate 8-phosphate phosphatase (KDO 8-P phosphatase)
MVTDKLRRIKVLLLDVDGVLTDGGIIYSDTGSELKVFSVKDGLGIVMLREAGIEVGIVTGRRSKALYHRCNDLGIRPVFDGVSDKVGILGQVKDTMGVTAEEIAFVGDDLPDLPLLRKVGLSAATADAHETVREHVDMVTTACGGAGAVREVCEAILKAKGLWDRTVSRFL